MSLADATGNRQRGQRRGRRGAQLAGRAGRPGTVTDQESHGSLRSSQAERLPGLGDVGCGEA